MKILICSKLFYPSNSIGAVRPSNLAKYLAKIGYEVTVLTEGVKEIYPDHNNGYHILRVPHSHFMQSIIKASGKRFESNRLIQREKYALNYSVGEKPKISDSFNGNVLGKFVKIVRHFRRHGYLLLIEIDWYIKAKRAIKRNFHQRQFEAVISSFGPLSSLLTGMFVKEYGFADLWISDLRDNMISTLNPRWLNKHFRQLGVEMVRKADAVIFVSEGQKQMFINSLMGRTNEEMKFNVVFNGYEEPIVPRKYLKKDKILRLCFTGLLYNEMRDFTMLLKVFDDLIAGQSVDPSNVEVIYAGPSSEEYQRQLSGFRYARFICKDLGMVDRATARQLQEQSDILVVLTWNTKKEQGIITGKFTEYLQAYKPIISLISGDVPGGELSGLIERLNVGIACEYCSYETDYLRLKEFIQEKYTCVSEGKPILHSPDMNEIKKFHYENLTMNFHDIIESLV